MCCDFTGKTALSTGAASGMGLLFAPNFAKLGGIWFVYRLGFERQQCQRRRRIYYIDDKRRANGE